MLPQIEAGKQLLHISFILAKSAEAWTTQAGWQKI